MTKYRKLPFGYTNRDGKIIVDENEAAVVRKIYHKYLAGESYLSIANDLNRSTTKYSDSKWNKNSVGRILKNEKYIENEIFSQIIDIDQFERVKDRIEALRSKEKTSEQQNLKGMVFCQNCNYPMNNRSDRWKCLKCDCMSGYNNRAFMNEISNRINMLIQNIDMIEIAKFEQFSTTLEIKRVENEINRELDKSDLDEDYIKNLVISLADTKYQVCDDDSKGRNAKRIIRRLKNIESKADIDLVKEIADRIIIDNNGGFFIELKNGQKV